MLECLDLIEKKNMYSPCNLLDKFMEFTKKKELKQQENTKLLQLLDNGNEDRIELEVSTTEARSLKDS